MSNSAISVGIYPAAAKADMIAATSNVLQVTPGVTQYHPGVGKGWVVYEFDLTPSIAVSYNITSITDNGTADHTINWTTAFASASYPVLFGMCNSAGASAPRYMVISSQTSSAVRYVRYNGASPEEANIQMSVEAIGSQ